MCFPGAVLRGIGRWNWDGDEILHRPIVSSSRTVLGQPKSKYYDTDPRGFLSAQGNAVMAKAMNESVKEFMTSCRRSHFSGGDWEYFRARSEGSFDFKAEVLTAFVGETIKYKSRSGKRDPWLLPEETLHLGWGDCEDRALLLASLLSASGISEYNLRVALGRVESTPRKGRTRFDDHVWVMYKTEAGKWVLLEPAAHNPKKAGRPLKRKLRADDIRSAEYVPYFLFNSDHLWCVNNNQFRHDESLLSTRKRWADLNPKFIGALHQTILNDALNHLVGEERRVLDALNRSFSRAFFFGPIVDAADTASYDPIDHFDNGYVTEGWSRIESRLNAFRSDNRNIGSFGRAAHAIADFYAHSTWPHFARIDRQGAFAPRAAIYDPLFTWAGQQYEADYSEGTDFDLFGSTFSVNPTHFKGSPSDRVALCQGKIISGRYAQRRDSHGFTESFIYIPNALERAPGFDDRGAYPHHEEIAVDSSDREAGHVLYSDHSDGPHDRMSYANQLLWRTNSAKAHIRQAFDFCWDYRR
ncbi:MAG: transglutaminase domain-containing protein [Planctomycetota bacterium]